MSGGKGEIFVSAKISGTVAGKVSGTEGRQRCREGRIWRKGGRIAPARGMEISCKGWQQEGGAADDG